MKTWNQLFVRHGWMLNQLEGNLFDCQTETDHNLQFLFQCFEKAGLSFAFDGERLVLPSEPISEEQWLQAIDFPHRGRGEGLWFRPGQETPKVFELDIYSSGVVAS
jgi:tripeptide aminopeptidase